MGGLAAFIIMTDARISALSALLDKYPISAYELPPPLDLEIRLMDFTVKPSTESRTIEVLSGRSDTIGSAFFRDSAIAGRLYREPGGWIADDAPLKKTESLHPKGMQKILAGAVPDPQELGTYLPRGDLKSGMSEADLGKFSPTRHLKSDRQ